MPWRSIEQSNYFLILFVHNFLLLDINQGNKYSWPLFYLILRKNKSHSVKIWIWHCTYYSRFFVIADLKRLLDGPHTTGKKPLKVMNQPQKKKVPLDPLKVHVQGLNEKTTKGSLWFYLEKFSNVHVTGVHGLQQKRNGRFWCWTR